MHDLKPVKLHTLIGTASSWTDELWDQALEYLRQNTITTDAIYMVAVLGIEAPYSVFKIDYLRAFRSYPPATLLRAFDQLRQHKASSTDQDDAGSVEPLTVASLLGPSMQASAPADHIKAIVDWCARREVALPEGKFPIEAQVHGNSVIILEHWPTESAPSGSIPVEVARLRYHDNAWYLYYRTPDQTWYPYKEAPAASAPAIALDELDRDPTGTFWG